MSRAFAVLIISLGSHALAGKARALDEEMPPEAITAGYAISLDDEPGIRTGKFRVVPYGSLWANMAYATQRTASNSFTLYVFSEEQQGEDAFHTDARRSRFGLDVFGADIPIDGRLKSGGRVVVQSDQGREFTARGNQVRLIEPAGFRP